MKKLVIAALLITGVGFAMVSCNNGAYDADPSTTGKPLNPLNPGSGISVYLGTMKANIFGTKTLFYPASYKAQEDGANVITGVRENDAQLSHTLTMSIFNMKSLSEFGSLAYYTYIDTTYHRYDSLITFGVAPNKGSFTITLSGNEDGNLRGHFYGTLYKIKPIQNLNDSVVFTDGEFYVPKK